jgi:hypothetical protein
MSRDSLGILRKRSISDKQTSFYLNSEDGRSCDYSSQNILSNRTCSENFIEREHFEYDSYLVDGFKTGEWQGAMSVDEIPASFPLRRNKKSTTTKDPGSWFSVDRLMSPDGKLILKASDENNKYADLIDKIHQKSTSPGTENGSDERNLRKRTQKVIDSSPPRAKKKQKVRFISMKALIYRDDSYPEFSTPGSGSSNIYCNKEGPFDDEPEKTDSNLDSRNESNTDEMTDRFAMA